MPLSAATSEPLTSGQGNVKRIKSRNRNSTSRTKHLLKKLKYGVLIFLFCGLLAHLLTTIVMPLIEDYFFKAGTFKNSTTVSLFKSCTTRIVGFYDGSGNRGISESQLQKLTHVVFGYLQLTSTGNLFFTSNGAMKKFVELVKKARQLNPELKVMFSIGGYIDYVNFPSVSASPEYRKNLAKSIKVFIQHHMVDGVDLCWKWPTKWENRDAYVLMLWEIRASLESIRKPLLLTIVSPSYDWPWYRDTFDLHGVSKIVDFVHVSSVRYYGYFEEGKGSPLTGPSSPLYSGIGTKENANVDWSMKHYTCLTKQPRRVNMGVPFFGAYWKNVEGPIDAKGEMWFTAKPKTKGSDQYEGGYIPWRNMKSEEWNVSSATWHQDSRTPFIWLPEKQKFLGFENAKSLREKVEYTKAHSLGGITIWSIEMDDDNDSLLNSVYSADLCYSNRNDTLNYNCD